jgi:outer membrane protein OmpA-like peptidoglycan-associated protein
MKLLLKTYIFSQFIMFSWFVYGSFHSNNSIQNRNLNQSETQQAAFFHPTILFFQTGSYQLDVQALSSIEKMVSELNNKPAVTFIISGFTDPNGSVAFNQILSEKRTEAVKIELLNRGFTESQFILKSFGESQSVNTHKTDNSKMRKVEIKTVILMK